MKAKNLLLQITICILALFLCFEQNYYYLDGTHYRNPNISIESFGEMSTGDAAKYIISKADGRFGIYLIGNDEESNFESPLMIHSSDKTEELLCEKYHIRPGVYRSILNENTSIRYDDLSTYTSDSSLISLFFSEDYIGAEEFANEMAEDLSKYDVEVTYSGGNSGISIAVRNVIIIWSASAVLLFALSLFDVALKKKETTVKIVNGDSAGKIVLKEILQNTVGLNLTDLLIFVALRIFYGYYPLFKETLVLVIFVSFISSLPYLYLFIVNIRKDLSAHKNANLVSVFSYSIKALTTFVSLILMLVALMSISKTYTFIKNTYVYEDLKGTTFMRIVPEELLLATEDYLEGKNRAYDIQNDVYIKYYSEANPVLLSETFDEESKIVYANTNAKKYLEKEFPEINSDSKIIAFIPDGILGASDNDLSHIDSLEQEFDFDVERVLYTNRRISPLLNWRFEDEKIGKENPVLIYFNLNPNEWRSMFEKDSSFLDPCVEDISFSFEDDDIKDIEKNYDLISKEIIKTDFTVQYEAQRRNANIKAVACTIMLVMTLLFTLQVYKVSMTMKFAVKGKEFAIKKVNGQSNLQLYYRMGIAEIVSFAVSLTMATVLLRETPIPLGIRVGGPALIFVILAVFFIVELKRTCIKNASKMIKGGML